jgi:hypothetical protein
MYVVRHDQREIKSNSRFKLNLLILIQIPENSKTICNKDKGLVQTRTNWIDMRREMVPKKLSFTRKTFLG